MNRFSYKYPSKKPQNILICSKHNFQKMKLQIVFLTKISDRMTCVNVEMGYFHVKVNLALDEVFKLPLKW